jgi:hypothetical protein
VQVGVLQRGERAAAAQEKVLERPVMDAGARAAPASTFVRSTWFVNRIIR